MTALHLASSPTTRVPICNGSSMNRYKVTANPALVTCQKCRRLIEKRAAQAAGGAL